MGKDCDPALIEVVLTAATVVHTALGAGLLESVYEKALAHELKLRGVPVEQQVVVPVSYKGLDLGSGFRLDLLVDRRLIVEIKSVQRIESVHIKQVLTYLRLTGLSVGYILNFNCRLLKSGIKRVSDFSVSP